jgi:hypothetical protein
MHYVLIAVNWTNSLSCGRTRVWVSFTTQSGRISISSPTLAGTNFGHMFTAEWWSWLRNKINSKRQSRVCSGRKITASFVDGYKYTRGRVGGREGKTVRR